MITDFVPGAYLTHDQLHLRGGHQVSWLIDGVPIPNTNIASNLGPQIDPKDIAALEVQRGSYSADYGDRTYGTFNVAPRTGFERSNEAELTLSAGNFYQTDDQLNFGGHTNRFAYYASLNGNRESDSFAAFSWVRVLNPGLLLTVSPFFHHNSANYESSAQDFPSSAIQDRASNYAGGQATVSWVAKRNTLRVGLYGFAQEDHQTFGLD